MTEITKAKPTTRTSKTTTKAAAKPTAVPVVGGIKPPSAEPNMVKMMPTVVSEPELRKKELIDLVVARSGIKKKDAKPVVEAMLEVLGNTLREGREMNLQPFGKLRINRTKEAANGRVVICKVRQSASSKDTLADKVE
jgi:DNA-binding protein HU-alpha